MSFNDMTYNCIEDNVYFIYLHGYCIVASYSSNFSLIDLPRLDQGPPI